MSILITADELAATPAVLLDVRWRLDRPDGSEEFRAGHVPGAVYVDLDHQLASHGEPADGRHPLPTVEALQAAARSWGVDDDSTVVVYDDQGNLAAARAWWLLTYAGVADIRVLDGGLQAWTESDRALETGDAAPAAGSVTLSYGHLPVVDADEVLDVAAAGSLLDARAPERYRGETEPIDPVAGHIPGAVNTPTGQNLADDGRFLDPATLRSRFVAAGVDPDRPVATYCGSGVTAAHNIVALTLAGFTPALYPGSWSQWSNQPERPVATGQTQGVPA
ncbi:sulfurtransferase [Aeromicrobium sp. 9AM]|uniref:sulfurtransferase n=1 Tax=Aeromicrobium sp. 9AM TaxID=2653126 RepID=UPI0012F3A890|nr:sulfurtransferase [Aeromicrobium sp. 9AM]VXB59561.1 putative thiosulfate sulfurtransferase SseB [Aeromicrobium sp. 9AM]